MVVDENAAVRIHRPEPIEEAATLLVAQGVIHPLPVDDQRQGNRSPRARREKYWGVSREK